MWFLGSDTMLTVTEPHILKELLLNKNGVITKDVDLAKRLSPILDKGLVTTEGKEWALHRRIVSPAFHHDRIKVSRSFILPIISNSIQMRFGFSTMCQPLPRGFHLPMAYQHLCNNRPYRLISDSYLIDLKQTNSMSQQR